MTIKFVQFTVKDAAGKVLRFGTCSEDTFDKQAINQGETVSLGLPPEEKPGPLLGDNYTANRYKAYPAVRNQLDALYHAMDAGVLPIVPDFYDPIKAVKEQFPKE